MSSNESDKAITHCVINARHNIALIQNWAGKLTYEKLSGNGMRIYAIMYAFIVWSEAVGDIPQSFLLKYSPPSLWQKIKSFRNMLAHTYDDMPDPRIMGTIGPACPNWILCSFKC